MQDLLIYGADEPVVQAEIAALADVPYVFYGFAEPGELVEGDLRLDFLGTRDERIYDFAVEREGERLGEVSLRIATDARTYFEGNIYFRNFHGDVQDAARAIFLLKFLAKRHKLAALVLTAPEGESGVFWREVYKAMGAEYRRMVELPEGLVLDQGPEGGTTAISEAPKVGPDSEPEARQIFFLCV